MRHEAAGANPNVDNLICVGATDNRDEAACWSNVGARQRRPVRARGLDPLDGARTATRRAAGPRRPRPWSPPRRRSLRADDTDAPPLQLVQALIDSVDVKAPLVPRRVAGGRLNVARALHAKRALRRRRRRVGGVDGRATAITTASATTAARTSARTSPGPALGGCPDSDGDGLRRRRRQLRRRVANADQADADGDRVGDVCDPTPRGDDADGDAKPRLDDAARTSPATRPTAARGARATPPGDAGARAPHASRRHAGPAPVVSCDVKVTLARCPKGKRAHEGGQGHRQALAQAKVTLKVERRVRKKGAGLDARALASLTATARGQDADRARQARQASRRSATA